MRISEGWDKRRMAAELRAVSDEPLPRHLHKMIGTWEAGQHKPHERYLLLYQRVFPGCVTIGVNGAELHGPDPETILDRARRMPGPADITALADTAIAAGMPRDKIEALAAAALEFETQMAVFRAHLQSLLSEDGDD